MIFRRLFLILSVLICFLSSCFDDLDNKEYFNFYNSFEEASYIEIVKGDFIYQLQYRPPEFLALNSLKSNKTISDSELSDEIDKYNQGLNFCLRIKSIRDEDALEANTASRAEYYQRIGQLTSEFQNSIIGVNKTDTIRCQFHLYEPSYKIHPFVQVLFSLNGSKEELPSEIVHLDNIFNKNELIRFNNFINYQESLPDLDI